MVAATQYRLIFRFAAAQKGMLSMTEDLTSYKKDKKEKRLETGV